MDIVDGKKRLWYCASDDMVAGVAVRASSVTPALLRSLPNDVIGPRPEPGGRLGARRRPLSSAKSTRLSMARETSLSGSTGGAARRQQLLFGVDETGRYP